MDHRVRVQEGSQLIDLSKAKALKIKKLRWDVFLHDWFPPTKDPKVDGRFWTLLQASFYNAYQTGRHRLFPHRTLDWATLRAAARGTDI